MEQLPHNLRREIVTKYLTLDMKRVLMRVNKWYYWLVKPWLRIVTVPSCVTSTPVITCKLCEVRAEPGKSDTLNTRVVDDLRWYIECDYGHRFLCHKRDLRATGPCPSTECSAMLKVNSKKRKGQ